MAAPPTRTKRPGNPMIENKDTDENTRQLNKPNENDLTTGTKIALSFLWAWFLLALLTAFLVVGGVYPKYVVEFLKITAMLFTFFWLVIFPFWAIWKKGEGEGGDNG